MEFDSFCKWVEVIARLISERTQADDISCKNINATRYKYSLCFFSVPKGVLGAPIGDGLRFDLTFSFEGAEPPSSDWELGEALDLATLVKSSRTSADALPC